MDKSLRLVAKLGQARRYRKPTRQALYGYYNRFLKRWINICPKTFKNSF